MQRMLSAAEDDDHITAAEELPATIRRRIDTIADQAAVGG